MSDPLHNPYNPPSTNVDQVDNPHSGQKRLARTVLNLVAVIVLLLLIRQSRLLAVFRSMYEGMGNILPLSTRIALSPLHEVLCWLGYPASVLIANFVPGRRGVKRIWPLSLAIAFGVFLIRFNVWAMYAPIRQFSSVTQLRAAELSEVTPDPLS